MISLRSRSIRMNEHHSWYVVQPWIDRQRLNKKPQMSLDPTLFHAELRVDTAARCAALLLPKDSLAILPFYQSQAEFESMDQDQLLSK